MEEDRLAVARYRGHLEDGHEVIVVVPRAGLPRRPVQHQRIANRLLHGMGGPTPPGFRAVWSAELDATLLVRSIPAGERASLLLDAGRLDPVTVYTALGRYLAARPADHQAAGWADANGFQSLPSFRAVLLRSAGIAECVLRVSALDPGPAAEEAFSRFAHALDHAVLPGGNALTHGGLGAPNLRFVGDQLVEIEGWTQCLLGDPLYDWGALHHMGTEAVDLAAAGADGLVDDRHRLALGYFGKVVLDLSTLAALSHTSAEPARAELVQLARHTVERSLEMAPPHWGCQPVPASPHALWHRVADAVRSVPPPDARDAAYIAGAIAALEMPGWTDGRRRQLCNRRLDALRPRLLAPFEDGTRTEEGHPLVLRIQAAVEGAFSGSPPFGFHAGLSIWSHAMRPGEPRDAYEAIRRALVLQWCGVEADPDELDVWWDSVSWRVEGSLTEEEALDRAEQSTDPLDLPRVLGALQLTAGPPRTELLGMLFGAS
jgi:hypothetical protein